jgi:hypothetical protein
MFEGQVKGTFKVNGIHILKMKKVWQISNVVNIFFITKRIQKATAKFTNVSLICTDPIFPPSSVK